MRYTRENPFQATLIQRERLNAPTSDKVTVHLTLDISGSEIRYRPGDSVAIAPVNADELVERTLAWIAPTADLSRCALWEHLQRVKDLTRCSRRLAELVLAAGADGRRAPELRQLIEEGGNALKSYLEKFFVWDFLADHLSEPISADRILDSLFPLIPRLYSIASSQSRSPNHLDLTVALTTYTTNGHSRYGVCSHYLCHHAPLNSPVLSIYLQPTRDFLLPEDPSTPIIMVGPGTGVAPFRAFMQERESRSAGGGNWLFFGERREACDFLYRENWHAWCSSEFMRLTTAFSRDGSEKCYVQHRMRAHSEEIYRWIESGASLYVCGDASQMAREVEATLVEILATEGNSSQQAARAQLRELRRNRRYLRDVY